MALRKSTIQKQSEKIGDGYDEIIDSITDDIENKDKIELIVEKVDKLLDILENNSKSNLIKDKLKLKTEKLYEEIEVLKMELEKKKRKYIKMMTLIEN